MTKHSHDLGQTRPPFLANQMMSMLLPKRLRDNMVGDLEEEFELLAKIDVKQANRWYWRQSIATSMVYLKNKLSSVEVLGRLNFYLPIAMFLIVAGLISVLSNLEDPELISPMFWGELLQGKIHAALSSSNFWHNFWSILRMSEWGMFIHFQSLIITTINVFVLLYLDKKQNTSTLKLAVWGYVLAFIPYVWSLVHIASHSFEAKQIGPIIATGILSLLYMLLPVSFIVHRRLKQHQAKNQQFEKDKLKQESNHGKRT